MIVRPFLAYSAVSAICMILHNIIVIGGDLLNWPYSCSILISFCLVTTIGYVLQSLLTFNQMLDKRIYFRYLVAMSANIPLAFVALWVWHDVVRLTMIWASPIATFSIVAINLLLSRWAILSRPTQVT
ncbi:GtrA family protein [Sphingopyxis granuli]|uniref:GtrA family protein n=1 Tax=Sphingopyxis granuli TaxID=267128 RepID=UPI003B849CBE